MNKLSEEEKTLNLIMQRLYYKCNSRSVGKDEKQKYFGQMVELLEEGASINLKLGGSESFFELFVKNSYEPGIDFLLKCPRWTPNYQTYKVPATTPLMVACYYQADLMKRVIKHPLFDPMFRDAQGKTAVEQLCLLGPVGLRARADELKMILSHDRMSQQDQQRQTQIYQNYMRRVVVRLADRKAR